MKAKVLLSTCKSFCGKNKRPNVQLDGYTVPRTTRPRLETAGRQKNSKKRRQQYFEFAFNIFCCFCRLAGFVFFVGAFCYYDLTLLFKFTVR